MGDALLGRQIVSPSGSAAAGAELGDCPEAADAKQVEELPVHTALFLGAFFDELVRWGVREVVVSPGSRSTPLAMCAYELSRRFPERLRLFVDVDERGAAFFALGLAKASGRPAALICTSGTAVANYYPAVMEAASSRVPLLVLTGDRPPRLQGLGAPQTCDQLKAFGDHVRAFRQMPLPAAGKAAAAFARQAAREACIAAMPFGVEAVNDAESSEAALRGGCAGGMEAAPIRLAGACEGGPVHLNFPFDEPLKPDLTVAGLFETARVAQEATALPRVHTHLRLDDGGDRLAEVLRGCRTVVLAGEGSVHTEREARNLVLWARSNELPLLADPLSGLRGIDDPYVIDNYDSVFGSEGEPPSPDAVIRFGRYPVSKRATSALAAARPLTIVVDPLETRDFNAATAVFVACAPASFVCSFRFAHTDTEAQRTLTQSWIAANDAARARIVQADVVENGFEGSFVRRVVELAPAGSCLFAGNSMSIRALDTFYLKSDKRLAVLCNRGLNGIDGTVSSALGAAQHFEQTTLLIGDLSLLHDLNALALQRELRVQREQGRPAASIVIVLLNNNGGAIFDMLPQQSSDPYFERLFLTPQDVDFAAAAQAFGVPYRCAETVPAFEEAYRNLLGTPGISLIEVGVPLEGLKERYRKYW
ncbi:MAG: thiamine pyrophosphate-binding protein [Gordonibacter sp.]